MSFLALLAGGTVWLVVAGPHLAASQRDWDDCKAALSDPDRGIPACTRIIESGGETERYRASAYSNRAGAYLSKGDNDRTIADASEAIRLNPGNVSAYSNRAGAYMKKGENDRAIVDANEAIRLNPRYANAYAIRAGAYGVKRDNDRAIADAGEAIRLDPGNFAAYTNRARAYLNKGDHDRAIADDNEAIRLDPANFDAYSNRAGAYVSKGDNDRAIADASEAIRLDPGNAIAYSNRAGVHMSNGDNDRAIADASEAIRLDPKSMPAYFSRGRANLYSGALPKAVADLDQASMLNPKDAYAALWLDIAGQRSNLPSRLLQAISRIDMTAWPAPVIQLFLGQLTPTAVLTAAGNADPNTKTGQVCEANFYGGELALRKAATAEATRLFRLAASNCSKGFIEWDGANAELKALGVLP